MKYHSLYILLAFALISCGEDMKPEPATNSKPGPEQMNQDLLEVKNLISNCFEDIWTDLDSNSITQYHTSDFMLLENGLVWNNDSIRNYLKNERIEQAEQAYQRLNHLEFIRSVHHQNTIWVAYDNYGTWVKGADTLGSVHWLESAIAIKEESRWKLQQLHSTRVRQ